MLQSIAECASAALVEFRAAATQLATETNTLTTTPSEPQWENARRAWERAIDIWQQIEVMQFGPLAPSSAPGGRDLRSQVYAWPLFARCITDQNLVTQAYAQPTFTSTSLITVRGLSALEYLLFYRGVDNGCSPATDINATGSWRALTPEQLASRKAAYAHVLATDLLARAQELVTTWEAFRPALTEAGRGSTVFATELAGLEAVSDALFYLDGTTKDLKLAGPLGLPASGTTACAAPPCPALEESPFAKRGPRHLLNNIVGYSKIFLGCGPQYGGFGFDDLLASSQAPNLGTTMTGYLNDIAVQIQPIAQSSPPKTLAEQDRATALRFFDAVKRLTDTMKTEFVGVLGLHLPASAEGDND